MDTTQNFGLKKPGANDFVDIDVLNENMDIIDEKCARESWYGTCPTSYGTSTKVVTTSTGDFKLKAGSRIAVKFTYYNTASSPMLNIDGTGAKYIKQYGSTAPGTYTWQSGEIVEFVYDGTYFLIVDGAIATTTGYGPTKLLTSVSSTAQNLAATPYAVKQAYDTANGAFDRADEAYDNANLAHAKLNRNSWEHSHIVTIETSQNWTVPANVHEIVVFLIGGGGGGGAAAIPNGGDNGGGGGGGGFAITEILSVSPGDIIPITIGAGGTGGIGGTASTKTPAQDGGTSCFGNKLFCAGGSAGDYGSGNSSSSSIGSKNCGGNGGSGGGGGAFGTSGIAGNGGSGAGADGLDYTPQNSKYPTVACGGAGGITLLKTYKGALCPINGVLYGGAGGGGACHAEFSDAYSSPGLGGAGGGGNGGNNANVTTTSTTIANGYPGTLYGAGGGGGSRCKNSNGLVTGNGGNGHAGVCIIAY